MRVRVRVVLGVFAASLFFAGCGAGWCAGERPALCIQGTMMTDERPVAIVNDRIVGVGDEVDGATVEAISDSSVDFTYDGESFSLLLGEECIAGADTASPPGGRGYRPKMTQTQADRARSEKANRALAVAASSMVFIVMLVVMVAFYAFGAYCLQRIAVKTGNSENGWWAWVPILNLILMVQIAGQEGWWVLLMLIPYVNIVIIVIVWMAICEVREKSPWLGLLVLVPVANVFLMAYLAFSSDEKTPPSSRAPEAPVESALQQEPPVPPPPPYIP